MTEHPAESAAPTFTATLKDALEHFNDPAWLGAHSPLAAPYFLGAAAGEGAGGTPRLRGLTLQKVLLSAALMLSEPFDERRDLSPAAALERLRQGSREQKLIYWKYLHHPRQSVQFISDQLNVARATFHRDVKDKLPEIIRSVAQNLIQVVRPSLRLEMPPAAPFSGRADLLAEVAGLARAGGVCLTGPIGVGKTALAARLAAGWPGDVMWLTFRPDLNDSPIGLLLGLGLFLHTHGASQLWSQIVADSDRINPQVAVGLAQADINSLARRPLICLDDIDLIREAATPARSAVRATLEALLAAGGGASFVLIGRAPWSDALPQRDVPALSSAEAAALLHDQKVLASPDEYAALWDYTQGNAQALKLVGMLYHSGETPEAMLARLAASPLVSTFSERLQQSLSAPEQRMIRELAVFRRPVPSQHWPAAGALLDALVERQIVQRDSRDAIWLWPLLKDAAYRQMSPAEKAASHRAAAGVRTQGGEYTAAAYHYAQGGAPDLALRIWFPNREQEMRDGQTRAALAVLQAIDPAALPARDQQTLALALAQLSKRTGDSAQALQVLQSTPWPADAALTAYARQVEGDLLEMQGLSEQALERYNQSLDSVSGLLEQQHVHLYARIGNLQMARFHNLDLAWEQACQARYAAELFQGEVQDERGNYAEARLHYQTALLIAEQLSDPLRQARSHFNLAIIAARREEVGPATFHFEQTLHWYGEIGDLVRLERTRTNLAAFYVQTGRFSEAVAPARSAFAFFEQVGFANWMALNAVNLADAHLGLGELGLAEDWASRALREEESPYVPYALATLGAVQAQRSQPSAPATLQAAIAAAQAIRDQFAEAPAWRTLGQFHLARSEWAAARAALAQAAELYAALHLPKEIDRTRKLLAELPAGAA